MYLELWKKATSMCATQDDINRLGEYMQINGLSCWNGEFWSIGCSHKDTDDSMRLYPVYAEIEPDEYEVSHYEIR